MEPAEGRDIAPCCHTFLREGHLSGPLTGDGLTGRGSQRASASRCTRGRRPERPPPSGQSGRACA
eukprot:14641864-Alexandrium_andersonii.AAC.1